MKENKLMVEPGTNCFNCGRPMDHSFEVHCTCYDLPEDEEEDFYAEEDTYIDSCSMCGGPVGILGKLGHVEHLMCRNCGMSFSREGN